MLSLALFPVLVRGGCGIRTSRSVPIATIKEITSIRMIPSNLTTTINAAASMGASTREPSSASDIMALVRAKCFFSTNKVMDDEKAGN